MYFCSLYATLTVRTAPVNQYMRVCPSLVGRSRGFFNRGIWVKKWNFRQFPCLTYATHAVYELVLVPSFHSLHFVCLTVETIFPYKNLKWITVFVILWFLSVLRLFFTLSVYCCLSCLIILPLFLLCLSVQYISVLDSVFVYLSLSCLS